MHKSELKTHPTLINYAIKEYKLRVWTTRPIGASIPLESNSEIDSTSHYGESTAFQYSMYITMRHQVLRFVTYYSLHENSS